VQRQAFVAFLLPHHETPGCRLSADAVDDMLVYRMRADPQYLSACLLAKIDKQAYSIMKKLPVSMNECSH
jgi:hypothetical protein